MKPIAMNKLGKFLFHSTFLAKFHGFCVRNFKSFKQLFLNWFWITAFNVWAWIDNFKYQILTLQNQRVADEKLKHFQQVWFLRSN